METPQKRAFEEVTMDEADLLQDSESVMAGQGASPQKLVDLVAASERATTVSEQLSKIDAPPGMSAVAVQAARVALNAGPRPELCKLCVSEPKNGKQVWCKSCRRKIEAAEYMAKQQDEAMGTGETPNKGKLESLKVAKDLTALRPIVFDFEAKTNPDGSRSGRSAVAKRGAYDFLQYEEFSSSASFVDGFDVVKYLNKFRFCKFWTDEEGHTPQEAIIEWDKRVASKCPRDNKGDKGELRLLTKVDEVMHLGNRMEKGNIVKGMMKPKKSPKAEDIDAMNANLLIRQDGFDTKFWEPLGGGESLRHVAGVNVEHAFQEDGDITVGATKRKAGAMCASSSEAGCSEFNGSATKAKLKDKESKLNKLRNDLTDCITDEEANARAIIAQEDEMRCILDDKEMQMSDYAPLIYTFNTRMFAVKLVFGLPCDVGAFFRANSFARRRSRTTRRTTSTPLVSMKCHALARCKRSQLACACTTKPPPPIADFDLLQTKEQLLMRIPAVGQDVATANDLKESKKEFQGHLERLKELLRATRRAAEDIRSRKAAKAAKWELQKQQLAVVKQGKAAVADALKQQKRVEKEEQDRPKKLKSQGADDLA